MIYSITRELRREVCKVVPIVQNGPDWQLDTSKKLSDASKRMAIRSIFSFMEGACFGLKTSALGSQYAKNITEAEKLIASEQSYDLNDAGEIKGFIPLSP